jgi:hypothetical protein
MLILQSRVATAMSVLEIRGLKVSPSSCHMPYLCSSCTQVIGTQVMGISQGCIDRKIKLCEQWSTPYIN